MTKQVQDREIIKVENLCKGFGELKVLRNINQHVNMGEVVSIIGPSGSGKSTFLRCLNLLEVPDSGKITFEGVEITDKKIDIDKHRQKMGMVFQHFNVFPNMTVLENTPAPVLEKKVPKEQRRRKRRNCKESRASGEEGTNIRENIRRTEAASCDRPRHGHEAGCNPV